MEIHSNVSGWQLESYDTGVVFFLDWGGINMIQGAFF